MGGSLSEPRGPQRFHRAEHASAASWPVPLAVIVNEDCQRLNAGSTPKCAQVSCITGGPGRNETVLLHAGKCCLNALGDRQFARHPLPRGRAQLDRRAGGRTRAFPWSELVVAERVAVGGWRAASRRRCPAITRASTDNGVPIRTTRVKPHHCAVIGIRRDARRREIVECRCAGEWHCSSNQPAHRDSAGQSWGATAGAVLLSRDRGA